MPTASPRSSCGRPASSPCRPRRRPSPNLPAADATFNLTAKASAAGGPLELRAIATDRFGATFETAVLELAILADEPPTGEVHLPAGAPASRLPGESVLFEFTAEDAEGLAEVTFVGETSAGVTRVVQPVAGLSYAGSRAIEVPFTAPAGSEVKAHLELKPTASATPPPPRRRSSRGARRRPAAGFGGRGAAALPVGRDRLGHHQLARQRRRGAARDRCSTATPPRWRTRRRTTCAAPWCRPWRRPAR